MPHQTLKDALKWTAFEVGAGAAHGVVTVRAGTAGSRSPVALITAGIHGDEGPWGAWAIHQLLEQVPLTELAGTLRVVPVTNPLAMEADARCAPLDALDLNRVFPGDRRGSHTERLAAGLVEHAVVGADLVIDLHGGGSWCVNSFVFSFAGAEDLAEAMGAPFIVSSAGRQGRRGTPLSEYATGAGAKVVAVEMGGRSPDEAIWAERIADGLYRVLSLAGVLTTHERPTPAHRSTLVGPSVALRAGCGGVFKPVVREKQVGTVVPGGTVFGHLLDPVSMDIVETFSAPWPETALMLLRPAMARVEGGAMMYVVAEPSTSSTY